VGESVSSPDFASLNPGYETDLSFVMPGLVPGIHVLGSEQGVDGRDKPGHGHS
jgi:hypothetical protein